MWKALLLKDLKIFKILLKEIGMAFKLIILVDLVRFFKVNLLLLGTANIVNKK